MKTEVETKIFAQAKTNTFEEKYYNEAKRRLELLRIMGLLDGPVQVSLEDVQQWCKDRDTDPACAQLDSMAAKGILNVFDQDVD